MKNSQKKETQRPASENGEIGIIRNILMGEHIAQYESNFKTVRELIEKNDQFSNENLKRMEDSFNTRLSELEKSTTDWFDAFEKNMNDRLDKLEQLLDNRVNSLESKMETDKIEDRESISDMLSTLSKTISNKK